MRTILFLRVKWNTVVNDDQCFAASFQSSHPKKLFKPFQVTHWVPERTAAA